MRVGAAQFVGRRETREACGVMAGFSVRGESSIVVRVISFCRLTEDQVIVQLVPKHCVRERDGVGLGEARAQSCRFVMRGRGRRDAIV